jgi:hypothetical protein
MAKMARDLKEEEYLLGGLVGQRSSLSDVLYDFFLERYGTRKVLMHGLQNSDPFSYYHVHDSIFMVCTTGPNVRWKHTSRSLQQSLILVSTPT